MDAESIPTVPVVLNRWQLCQALATDGDWFKVSKLKIYDLAKIGELKPDYFDGLGAPLYLASRIPEIAVQIKAEEAA